MRLAVAFAVFIACTAGFAADIKVICPSGLRAPMLEVARGFVRGGTHRVELVFASPAAIHKRIATGDKFDIAIGTAEGVNALVRLGRGVAGSESAIVRTALAAAIAKERKISQPRSADEWAMLMTDASAIVIPDLGRAVPGGAQAAELIERLAIGPVVMDKLHRAADYRELGKRVIASAAVIGIGAMSDLLALSEVAVLGPIEEQGAGGVVYSAVIVPGSTIVDAGRAFIAHLRSNDALKVFRAAGYLGMQ